MKKIKFMNYKNLLIKELTDNIDIEDNKPLEKALILIKKFLNLRFQNELKQYNFEEEKAYDEFVAKKNLNYLNIYIEELYLLDEEIPTNEKIEVKQNMRYILNFLWSIVNKYS